MGQGALNAGLGFDLGYPSGAGRPETAKNGRNGKIGKTLLTVDGTLRIDFPATGIRAWSRC